MEHDLNENRKLVAMKNKMRQLEEQKLNMSVAITNETKKRLNKLTKLKEIKVKILTFLKSFYLLCILVSR